ncbi:MAG: sulfate ABC transporter ATP-binding protein [Cyanobacteria bacterium M5B4]|nr:sulfate ABC transporter ATP-binding protein [Cyanobacteria bacterium KgW148]PLS69045.1 MAG: sulfate ABC transporter ATP-binding protein [Cyanobacteria bacterium M5B4]
MEKELGITVDHISKRFGDFVAVDRVSLEFKAGELIALLGPSGSGKSTLLRLIAGLELPDEGKILITGKDTTYQQVQDRNIGFVFQHYALFRHMTVRQNIGFGLTIRKTAKAKIKARVDDLLELVQLKGLGDRYPDQLSGGQRQRVALARALAVEPQILLLDEPFGALDAQVRKELRQWLRRLHDEVHVTTVFVTHDQEEAMEISDRIVVMNKGRVEQIGTPAEIYDHPATPFVMQFIGPVNIMKNGDRGQLFIRPQDVIISPTPGVDSKVARVVRIINLGWEVQIELLLKEGETLMAHLSREDYENLHISTDQQVFITSKEARSFPLDYMI